MAAEDDHLIICQMSEDQLRYNLKRRGATSIEITRVPSPTTCSVKLYCLHRKAGLTLVADAKTYPRALYEVWEKFLKLRGHSEHARFSSSKSPNYDG